MRIWEVGTILSKAKPGLGARVDRMVYDPMAYGQKNGGLEVKCPYTKAGMSVNEACSDSKFYLTMANIVPSLRKGHVYYYQVQGQMYVCELEWVDFVVWFGNEVISIERISFDKTWWHKYALPALNYFYARAFIPEVLTRRIERKTKLYKHGGLASYKNSKKLRGE